MKRVALIGLLLVGFTTTVNASTSTGAPEKNFCAADVYELDKSAVSFSAYNVESVCIADEVGEFSNSIIFDDSKAVEAVCVNRYLHKNLVTINLVNDVGKRRGIGEMTVNTGPLQNIIFRRARDGFMHGLTHTYE